MQIITTRVLQASRDETRVVSAQPDYNMCYSPRTDLLVSVYYKLFTSRFP